MVRNANRFLASFLALIATLALFAPDRAAAQNCNGFRVQQVGGISISPEGVLALPDSPITKEMREQIRKEVREAAAELNKKVSLRKISLRAIEEAVAKSDKNVTFQLPEEIRFLAGIQRIQYILVYPEQNDIVLAGPGEGWKIDERANIVGQTTGRPVLQLEDLVVALRSVENARNGAISVSIDPTAEGRQQFEKYIRSQKTFAPAVLNGIEKALGAQQVTITGVPATSRFARLLTASDYKMKRIAMKLEESPLPELPSYLDMMKKEKVKLTNMMPRWWMACNYEPIAKSEDGLAWEIRGPGVKVLTEDEVVGADGGVAGTGKTSPVAQKWSNLMTEHYDELSLKEPVFGDLRNLMDLSVVAALIAKEKLLEKAHVAVPTLQGANSKLQPVSWPAPKTVATQCSFIKRDREYIITASGGVDINSWGVADKTVTSAEVGQTRQKATAATGAGLWWN
jgi:hypothetical protein